MPQRQDHDSNAESETLTTGEWLSSWLGRRRAWGHVTDVTRARYGVAIRVHLDPVIGSIRLQDLRRVHITDMVSRWLATDDDVGPPAPASIKKNLGVLRHALNDAVANDIIPRNPAEHVTAPPNRGSGEKRALSEDEIVALLAGADGTRYDTAIRFTLATGLRRGELLALR
ncbi:MAG TPA: hypothetical protein QF624_00605 [Dehalococcoidia bacterium]|nr:hypothetical protein [Dehalococcoidia bacterium]